MDAPLLPKSWNIDQILEDLDLHGFAMLDDAYSPEYQQQVLAECSQNLDQFRAAAIQNGVVSKIRSDHILWIHEDLSIAQQHTQTLLALAEQFNQAFYFGIREVEAHFASYIDTHGGAGKYDLSLAPAQKSGEFFKWYSSFSETR